MAAKKIREVFAEIRKYGFSRKKDFSIGHVEKRMRDFAKNNNILMAKGDLYMGAKSLFHSRRPVKVRSGKDVSELEIENFPRKRSSMDLYFDGESFVYTDYKNKFIVHPYYDAKTLSGKKKKVVYVTATKVTDVTEFTHKGNRYTKV